MTAMTAMTDLIELIESVEEFARSLGHATLDLLPQFPLSESAIPSPRLRCGVCFVLELTEGVEGGASTAVFEIGAEDAIHFEVERIPGEGGGGAVGGRSGGGGGARGSPGVAGHPRRCVELR